MLSTGLHFASESTECQACSRMQSLDVKFVVHQGEFIRHKMSGREELAGRDVILVHRLLKNDVSKTFGAHAYALYSDACVRAVGIDPQAQGLVEHSEAIEHIGETICRLSRQQPRSLCRPLGKSVVNCNRREYLSFSTQSVVSGSSAPRAAIGRRGRFESATLPSVGAVLFSAAVGVSKPPGQLPFKIPFPTVSDRSG